MNLYLLILIGGVLHFVLLGAGAMVPKALHWREAFASLPPFLRRLVWVYAAFVFLMIVAFGSLSLVHATELAAGGPLARSLCAVIALCWSVRLGVQWMVFDIRLLTLGRLQRVGYHALTVVFALLVVIYGLAAMPPVL